MLDRWWSTRPQTHLLAFHFARDEYDILTVGIHALLELLCLVLEDFFAPRFLGDLAVGDAMLFFVVLPPLVETIEHVDFQFTSAIGGFGVILVAERLFIERRELRRGVILLGGVEGHHGFSA